MPDARDEGHQVTGGAGDRPLSRRPRRGGFWKGLAAALVLVVVGLVATARPLAPTLSQPPGAPGTVTVWTVDNGMHTDIALPVGALRTAAAGGALSGLAGALARLDAGPAPPGPDDHLVIGWGDASVYDSPPQITPAKAMDMAAAAFGLSGETWMHTALARGRMQDWPYVVRLVAVGIPQDRFAALLERVEDAFAHDAAGAPIATRPGLYGEQPQFWRSDEPMWLGQVCNHWVGHALSAGGAPVHRLGSGLSGLLADEMVARNRAVLVRGLAG